LSGIDRDVVDADFAAPSPLQPYLDGTFTDRGLTGLAIAIRRDLINHIRKSGISGAEIAPYARIEQAVVGVGLDRKKAPYVTAALKRAALKAGLNGEGITAEMLENPLGTATPEGVILDAELGGIHITLSRDQKAALLNSIPQEFVLQTFSREGDQLFDGTKPSGVRTDLGYDVLVIDRTLLSMNIDRSKPFTAADVSAPIRAKIKEEYEQIGIDIDATADTWTDQDIAGVIEAVRSDTSIVRMDIDPRNNKNVQSAVVAAGFLPEKVLDILTSIQDFSFTLRAAGIQRPMTDEVLDQKIEGKTLESYFHEVLKTATGVAAIPSALDKAKLVTLINESQNVPLRQIHAEVSQKVEIINTVMDKFMRYEGSYHEGALLGVLLSELDADSINDLRQSFEQVLLHNEDRDIAHILSRIPDPPRSHIREKVAHTLWDGVNGFLDIYNASHPPGILVFRDIPVAEIRQIAGLVLGHRLGAGAHPFPGYIEAQTTAYNDMMNAHFNTAQFDRAITKLDATFWGLEAERLTYAIEKHLGGEAFREEALIYTQAINARRKKSGFIIPKSN